MKQQAIQVIVGVNAVTNLLTGLLLLFAPQWFYDNIASFAPYNQHFLGDVGAFILAFGIGLLFAIRQPERHRSLIGAAALGGLVHVGNHLYADVLEQGATMHWLTNTIPLLVMALALAWAWWQLAD
jgi:hypothetical protein